MHTKLAVALALSIATVGTALAKTQTGDHGTVTAVDGHASYVELVGTERTNETMVELAVEVQCPEVGAVTELLDSFRTLAARAMDGSFERCALLETPYLWLLPDGAPDPRSQPVVSVGPPTGTQDEAGRSWTVHRVDYLTMASPTEKPTAHRAWVVALEPAAAQLRLDGEATVHARFDAGAVAPGEPRALSLQVLPGTAPTAALEGAVVGPAEGSV